MAVLARIEKRCLKGLISPTTVGSTPTCATMKRVDLSGRFWKWTHLFGIFFFIALWIVAWIFGWIESVVFVSHVSMVALVLSEIAAWQASRVEQKEDKRED